MLKWNRHHISELDLSRRRFGNIGWLGAKNWRGVAVAYGSPVFCETYPRLANPARSWSSILKCDVYNMNLNSKETEQLISAILTLKTQDEAKRFLRDLMTEKEITEFTKRLAAAQMLTKKIPYSVIEKKTGLSSTTVARVSKWLNGKEGGYKKAIQKMHHHNQLFRKEIGYV